MSTTRANTCRQNVPTTRVNNTCLLLCRTQVFGPDELGTRRHPFFLMGLKLQPDDPRGWDWFTPRAARQRWHRCARLPIDL